MVETPMCFHGLTPSGAVWTHHFNYSMDFFKGIFRSSQFVWLGTINSHQVSKEILESQKAAHIHEPIKRT